MNSKVARWNSRRSEFKSQISDQKSRQRSKQGLQVKVAVCHQSKVENQRSKVKFKDKSIRKQSSFLSKCLPGSIACQKIKKKSLLMNLLNVTDLISD